MLSLSKHELVQTCLRRGSRQNLQRLGMDARVAGGDDAAALADRRAAPIGDDAPAFSTMGMSAATSRRERCLDNQIDMPQREKAIGVAIAAKITHARTGAEFFEARAFHARE